VTTYVVITRNKCLLWNKLHERDLGKQKIPINIRKETSMPFLKTMIPHKDTFEQPKRKFISTTREVTYKTCGTKNTWRKTL